MYNIHIHTKITHATTRTHTRSFIVIDFSIVYIFPLFSTVT